MLAHIIENPFTEFGLIFVVVFLITVIMRLLKQPFIVGYIIAGIIFSPTLLGLHSVDLEVYAQLGVVLLLFIAGLHLNPYYLKTDGKAIVFAGLGQIAVTSLGSYGIARLLGIGGTEAIFIAIAMTLSSTIISLKTIADRKHNSNLYARLSIGILLIQDIFVALAIVALNAIENSSGGSATSLVLGNIALAIVVLIPAIVVQRYILAKVLNRIARSQEFLFLFIISWVLLFAGIFEIVGFSLEVGALVAGVLLASSVFAPEISAKITPLRDFFLILFFVNLGTQIDLNDIQGLIVPISVFSAFVLFIKPIIVAALLGLLGFTRKLSARTALNLSHISEFSLILSEIARSSGLISNETAVVVTITALITITFSTYIVKYDQLIIDKLDPFFRLFEMPWCQPERSTSKKHTPQIIVIGAKRGGQSIIQSLKKLKKSFLVVDYNPETIKRLRKLDIPSLFSDVRNLYHQDELEYKNLKYVVSTSSDVSTNLAALQFFNEKVEQTVEYLCYAIDDQDALQLYHHGASYVLIPHHVGGKFVSTLIETYDQKPEELLKHKMAHLDNLKIDWTKI